MKDTYRVAKIMKRMFRQGFHDSFLAPELSSKGRKMSKALTDKSENRTKPVAKPALKDESEKEQRNNQFVKYQKEFTAYKILNREPPPEKPGEIIKLPLHFPPIKKTDQE